MIDFTKPVKTRDGKEVRILCTDRRDKNYPVVALIGDTDETAYYTKGGKYFHDKAPSTFDLVNVSQECWVNIYYSPSSGCFWLSRHQFNSKKEAADNYKDCLSDDICVKTIKLEIPDV